MPKEEWGVKRVCPTTGKRFYDMNRSPVVSPYTGEVVSVDTGGKTRILVADKDDIDAKKDDKVEDDLLLDDEDVDLDDEEDDAAEDVIDEDDDDTVSLDEIADVGSDDGDDD